ncbi:MULTISPECIES: aspartate/glutamate racemase family protein [unclassified Saccharicrinis]|uniref:aspartate/glutamate racemase family protein n=1 Tax=unclassified Saccharicrinis TaxID=2646859 RepID=UPI003D342B21
MRTLGLIGGTSWHSTIEYYRYINQRVNNYFGNNTNPPLLVFTLNQALIHKYQIASNWEGIAELLIEAARKLENAGAEKLMFCANTPHKVYHMVEPKIHTSIIHIADATAKEIKSKGINRVCFLGTRYSMLETFITNRIAKNNIQVYTPQKNFVVDELHRIIQKELTFGKILPESKDYVTKVIQSFIDMGVEGVVLGCTEFPLMIRKADLKIPVFNTTEIHAKAGVDFILKEQ